MVATFASPAQDTQVVQKTQDYQDSVPMLDLTVHHDDLFNGAASVTKQLFPEWNMDNISYVQFKDGITNKCKFSLAAPFALAQQ